MAIWPFWPHRQLCPQGLYFWFCQRNSIASTNSNSLFSPQATPSFSFFFSTNRPIRSILPHTHTHTLTHTEATLTHTGNSLSLSHTLSLSFSLFYSHTLSHFALFLFLQTGWRWKTKKPVMKRTTGGLHGWKLCSERASLKNASCTVYAALSLDAIGTAWIAWTVLSALSVSKTTRTTILFRYHFLSLNLKFSSLLPNLFVWRRKEKHNRLSWMNILYCSFFVLPYGPPVNNYIRTD